MSRQGLKRFAKINYIISVLAFLFSFLAGPIYPLTGIYTWEWQHDVCQVLFPISFISASIASLFYFDLPEQGKGEK